MNRIQVNFGKGDSPKSDPSRTITLFLSLYLLVLAFFILLVSISSLEDVKSKALMDSLSSTFSSVLPPRMELKSFNSTTGEVLAADDFQKQVTGLFSTVIGVTRVEAIQPGRLMRIELSGDGLFETDQAVVRDAQLPFVDRLVAAMSAAPNELRYDLEFVAGLPLEGADPTLLQDSLPVKRTAAFAELLMDRGAPPGSVAVGLRNGEEDVLEIWFRIRNKDENRIRFEESPLIKVPEKPKEAPPPPKPVTLSAPTGGVSIDLPQAPAQGGLP